MLNEIIFSGSKQKGGQFKKTKNGGASPTDILAHFVRNLY